jgi:hypothetical protein
LGVLVPCGRTAVLLRVLSALLDTGLSQLHASDVSLWDVQNSASLSFHRDIGSVPRADKIPSGTTVFPYLTRELDYPVRIIQNFHIGITLFIYI